MKNIKVCVARQDGYPCEPFINEFCIHCGEEVADMLRVSKLQEVAKEAVLLLESAGHKNLANRLALAIFDIVRK